MTFLHILLPSVRPGGLELYERLQEECSPLATVVMDRKPGGFWKALNRMISHHKPERFVWLADDCEPKEGWLENLIGCWKDKFPDDYGLAVCNDLVVMQGGAAFAMTTPQWLSILFGNPWFPKEFGHKYLDTIIADRSKDLGRYFFCKNAVAEHNHYLFGKAEMDTVYENNLKRGLGDKRIKDDMDNQWKFGGKEDAIDRMKRKGIEFHAVLPISAPPPPPPAPINEKRSQSKNQSHQSRR